MSSGIEETAGSPGGALPPGSRLSLARQISYALGNFGVAFSPTVVSMWLGYFYFGQKAADGRDILYVTPAVFSVIWFATQILNAFTDPAVGYLSDRTRSRFGRRKPWILIGAPLLALCFFFLWTPPTDTPSTGNAVVLLVALFGFWFFFTVVVAPYLALLPEITPYDHERVRISTFMGLCEVLGTIAGNLLPVILVGGFLFLHNEYEVTAFVGAICLVLFFYLSAAFTRESYQVPTEWVSERKGPRAVLKEFLSVFKNPAFPPYVVGAGFYRMAIATIVFVTPFIATKILSNYPLAAGERTFLGALGAVADDGQVDWERGAGYLMMLVLVGAAAFFPVVSWMARKIGKRALYVVALGWLGVILILMATVGYWPILTPFSQALALFALAAFPVAVALVIIRPILADVIDADERITGLRREGIYNGMEGLIQKTGAGLGPGLAGLLFQFFGSTPERNLGIRLAAPLAGLCLLVAGLAFTRYPIKD